MRRKRLQRRRKMRRKMNRRRWGRRRSSHVRNKRCVWTDGGESSDLQPAVIQGGSTHNYQACLIWAAHSEQRWSELHEVSQISLMNTQIITVWFISAWQSVENKSISSHFISSSVQPITSNLWVNTWAGSPSPLRLELHNCISSPSFYVLIVLSHVKLF